MSKKHTLTREPKARALVPENPRLEEGFEIGAVAAPDIDTVDGTNRVEIYALRQPQPGEKGIPQVLIW